MKQRSFRYFSADFETTSYDGQEYTEVWASASVELYTEDVYIFHSIDEQFNYFASLECNVVAYYHNLKFDGQFWLSFLHRIGLEQAVEYHNEQHTDLEFKKEHFMPNNTFKYSISEKGQWYTIIIKVNNNIIEIRDSLKLLPFSVKKIGDSFKTKHRKLDMEYKGFRYAGCTITDKEKEYIKNDVLVVKEALEIMFNEGHNLLTIGACCLNEFKKITGKYDFENFFPNVYTKPIPKEIYGEPTIGDYIRHSYKGGWCYVVKGKEGKIYNRGITADVNSLYPSMMSSESGNKYPIGLPMFWKGNEIPEKAKADNKYYFVRIKTRFYIKPNKLPFIQIKGSHVYKGTEYLITSDVWDKNKHQYCAYYTDELGKHDTRVELTLTMTDYELLLEHYDLVDFEILDGCYFYSIVGIFDEYIEKYKKMKLENTGAIRELAKLFLNNLYGKMASSTDSSFKYTYLDEDDIVRFMDVQAHDKQPGYIPVGSAITSYARNFTIRTAQLNYYGVNKRGFIYADTDSIHCDLNPNELRGITVHDKNFCCWKLEATWDKAIFTRQKTYIEHVIEENLTPIDKPYNNIKCAGMPERCKDLLNKSLEGYEIQDTDEYDPIEEDFIKVKRGYEDFKIGLIVPGKLVPKRIKGGVILVYTTYEMR